MKSKDKPDTPAENNLTPSYGYVVFKDSSGELDSKYVYSGYPLKEGEIFVKSEEEACALTGNEFNPVTSYSFSDETASETSRREDLIREGFKNINSSLEAVAFNLYWIYKKKSYIVKGHNNIVSYSAARLGCEKTTCYSLIGIVERFAERDADGNILEKLDSSVKDYSISKLSLMVNLTDDQIGQLRPSMSVREIKKYIKGLEEKPALPDNSAGAEAVTGPQEPSAGPEEDNTIESTAKEVNRSVLISCRGSGDYEKKSSKIGSSISRILKKHPDALIEVSYTLP